MELDITIPELNDLVQRYGNIGPIVQEEHKRAHDRSGAQVERTAKGRVKVKTGHLRRSTAFATTGSGYAFETKIGTAVEYGPYLNYGTSRGIEADYWLTGAFDLEKANIRKEFDQIPKRIVNRVTKGGGGG